MNVGNIITILVLTSSSMRTTSTNMYLTALSCSNILFLLIFVYFFPIVHFFYLLLNFCFLFLSFGSDLISCKFLQFFLALLFFLNLVVNLFLSFQRRSSHSSFFLLFESPLSTASVLISFLSRSTFTSLASCSQQRNIVLV